MQCLWNSIQERREESHSRRRHHWCNCRSNGTATHNDKPSQQFMGSPLSDPENALPLSGHGQRIQVHRGRRSRFRYRHSVPLLASECHRQAQPRPRLHKMKITVDYQDHAALIMHHDDDDDDGDGDGDGYGLQILFLFCCFLFSILDGWSENVIILCPKLVAFLFLPFF